MHPPINRLITLATAGAGVAPHTAGLILSPQQAHKDQKM